MKGYFWFKKRASIPLAPCISIVADSDPEPDPCVFEPPESASVRGTDLDPALIPDPDPFIIKQK